MVKILPYLNIRRKVQIGLTLVLVFMAVIGFISFNSLHEIERKQHFAVIADDLSNLILEIRRYEKNYLLYHSLEDLEENKRYIGESITVLHKIVPDVEGLKAAPLLEKLEKTLLTYRSRIEALTSDRDSAGQGVKPDVQEELRNLGKDLVDLSTEIVSFERDKILTIIYSLKAQLLSSIVVFLLVGAFLIPLVSFKIIRPLSIIEKTTLRIAKGDFRPIPVQQSHDETQRVVEAFNRMVAELEQRQDQLLQAKKLSSLGTLTSGIAHQLNNPLNNMSTSCQILLEDLNQFLTKLEEADGQLLARMLGNIEQEVQRARDIVRGLLEFSREKEFCLVRVPLHQVVDRSIRLISSQIPSGIRLSRQIPSDLCLNIDSQRMQQVFLNLIENAVCAIGDKGGEIRLSAEKQADAREVLIWVEDNGMGIAEKELARVFDPFYTTKEVGCGTGLGLSIVYGIIQKHNGTIEVDSKQGEGTRFSIRLPLEPVC